MPFANGMIHKGHFLESIEVQDTVVRVWPTFRHFLAAHIKREKHLCLLVVFVHRKDLTHLLTGKSSVFLIYFS